MKQGPRLNSGKQASMLKTIVNLVSEELYDAHRPSCTVVYIARTELATDTTSQPKPRGRANLNRAQVNGHGKRATVQRSTARGPMTS